MEGRGGEVKRERRVWNQDSDSEGHKARGVCMVVE